MKEDNDSESMSILKMSHTPHPFIYLHDWTTSLHTVKKSCYGNNTKTLACSLAWCHCGRWLPCIVWNRAWKRAMIVPIIFTKHTCSDIEVISSWRTKEKEELNRVAYRATLTPHLMSHPVYYALLPSSTSSAVRESISAGSDIPELIYFRHDPKGHESNQPTLLHLSRYLNIRIRYPNIKDIKIDTKYEGIFFCWINEKYIIKVP